MPWVPDRLADTQGQAEAQKAQGKPSLEGAPGPLHVLRPLPGMHFPTDSVDKVYSGFYREVLSEHPTVRKMQGRLLGPGRVAMGRNGEPTALCTQGEATPSCAPGWPRTAHGRTVGSWLHHHQLEGLVKSLHSSKPPFSLLQNGDESRLFWGLGEVMYVWCLAYGMWPQVDKWERM